MSARKHRKVMDVNTIQIDSEQKTIPDILPTNNDIEVFILNDVLDL